MDNSFRPVRQVIAWKPTLHHFIKIDKFLLRQTNLLKKLAMRMNSGSPIQVLVSLLNTDPYRLNDMIATKRYPKNSGAGLE